MLVLFVHGALVRDADWWWHRMPGPLAGHGFRTAAVAISDSPSRPELPPAPGRGLDIDRHAHRVSVDGRPVELSYREFELLAFLAEHPGRVFSRRQLVSSVWNGADVGSRTVDVHVRRLRMKLGRYAAGIVTVRNVGYRYEPARATLETVA